MVTRVLTSAIGLIIFFAAFFADELIFAAAVAVVATIMVYEATKALNAGKAVTIVSVLLCLSAYGAMIFADAANVTVIPGSSFDIRLLSFLWITAGAFLYMILAVVQFGKVDCTKIYASAFVTLYIAIFMSFVVLLRNYVGRYGVIAVFMFSWITDTGAYFAGSLAGKHKLAPELSPKKTVEGAIGGICLTVIASVVYILILKYCLNINIMYKALFLVAAAIGAVLSEIGDLAASALKRQCKVKDFGWIFPGHGGMLDRFDSVVFIAPYVYLVFVLLQIGH